MDRRRECVARGRDGSVAARATEQEDKKDEAVQETIRWCKEEIIERTLSGRQSKAYVVPSNARTLACMDLYTSLLLRPATTQSRPQSSATYRHVSSCSN